MIDNFEIISNFIQNVSGINEESFYFVQIIKRKKDLKVKGTNNNHRLVKAFYVNNLEYLHKKKGEIVQLCHQHGARAMIHLSPRNYQKIALELLSSIALDVSTGNVQKLHRKYNSICGKNSGMYKYWIVDLDKQDILTQDHIDEIIDFINKLQPLGNKVLAKIPSKSGLHLISKPFNLNAYQKQYAHDVHKNNPTNLYIAGGI